MFHIPDAQEVPLVPEMSSPFAIDFDMIARGAGGRNGVISGGAVSEAGTPGMSVVVPSTVDVIDGLEVIVAADTLILDTADPALPRWDVVLAEADGSLTLHTGDPAVSPAPLAALPLSTVLHGRIWVPPAETAITDDQIIQLQIPAQPPIGVRGWTTLTADDQAGAGTRSNDAAMTFDSLLKFTAAANTKYRFRAGLFFAPKAASGGRVSISGPASPTFLSVGGISWRNAVAAGPTLIPNVTAYPATQLVTINAAGEYTILLDGIFHNGSTSGTFGITWGQTTAVAENTIRRDGSWLEYEVV